jgi:DNA-binding response OmpR family regulator
VFHGKRVLVVEDNLLIGYDLADELADLGAEVIGPIQTLAEAMHIAATADLDGAILDLHLLDGIATPIAEILEARSIPFLFCTGNTLPEALKAKIAAGDVIMKPAPSGALVRRLAEKTLP